MPSIIDELKSEIARGKTPEEIVVLMHHHGLSIIESIKTYRTLYGVTLAEAKQAVSNCELWETVVEAAQPLHDELIRSLNEINES